MSGENGTLVLGLRNNEVVKIGEDVFIWVARDHKERRRLCIRANKKTKIIRLEKDSVELFGGESWQK